MLFLRHNSDQLKFVIKDEIMSTTSEQMNQMYNELYPRIQKEFASKKELDEYIFRMNQTIISQNEKISNMQRQLDTLSEKVDNYHKYPGNN